MNLASQSGRGVRCMRPTLVCLSAAFLLGCQTEPIVLSPSMHARIVDGETGKPLDHVRVTLLSRDAPMSATAYSNGNGFVDMPGLLGQGNLALRFFTDAPHAPVHAIFERPGYEPYMIDAVNGYGFFQGYRDIHLYRD